ncbi:MAG: Holliday junction resolvase RuvX [Bacteroidetes bacterium]|nr:Holliday junction resolvase RuvX [Bacteroidota bacterium]
MRRLIGIDYGEKRVGIAITDPEKIISMPLETINQESIIQYLRDYILKENIEAFVVGWPINLNGKENEMTSKVQNFINKLSQEFSDIEIYKQDERFTSKIAFDSIIKSGLKKKDRRNKSVIDKVSASLILRSFIERNKTL